MRSVILLALFVPAVAHADSVFEVGGALTSPVGDDNWTNTVNLSPEVGVRVGAGNHELAGLLSGTWTPERLKNDPNSASLNESGQRFRVLANLEARHRVAPKLTLSARLGGGIDIAHGSYKAMLGPLTSEGSDTDVGVAFEGALGLWIDLGTTNQLGIEVAVPYGHHSKTATTQDPISFDYTQVDVDVWAIFRFGD